MRPLIGKRLADFFAILGYAIFSLVAIAILLELFSWVGLSSYNRIRQSLRPAPAPRPLASEPWTQEFWKEESVRTKLHRTYLPFRVWGLENWHGNYVNNDEGKAGLVRRTINPTDPRCTEQNTRRVWMFGGSAVYGTGVPDWATLPSYLSSSLNASGPDCAVVVNFGVEGYVTNQEVNALVEQLKVDRPPEIVIFYDGVNDAGAAAFSLGPPLPHFIYIEVKHRIEGSMSGRLDFLLESHLLRLLTILEKRLHPRTTIGPTPEELHRKAIVALSNYEANLGFVRALSKAYGFKLYCFWQPSLYYGHKPLVPFEQEKVNASNPQTDYWSPAIIAGYPEAESRAAKFGDFVFLGGLFDSARDPLFVDMVHLAPLGNKLVANYIAAYMRDHS
jgi:lysophospholipase L1-like esterase